MKRLIVVAVLLVATPIRAGLDLAGPFTGCFACPNRCREVLREPVVIALVEDRSQHDAWSVMEMSRATGRAVIIAEARGTPHVVPSESRVFRADVAVLWRFIFGTITPDPEIFNGEFVAQVLCDDGRLTTRFFDDPVQLLFWLADHFEIERL